MRKIRHWMPVGACIGALAIYGVSVSETVFDYSARWLTLLGIAGFALLVILLVVLICTRHGEEVQQPGVRE